MRRDCCGLDLLTGLWCPQQLIARFSPPPPRFHFARCPRSQRGELYRGRAVRDMGAGGSEPHRAGLGRAELGRAGAGPGGARGHVRGSPGRRPPAAGAEPCPQVRLRGRGGRWPRKRRRRKERGGPGWVGPGGHRSLPERRGGHLCLGRERGVRVYFLTRVCQTAVRRASAGSSGRRGKGEEGCPSPRSAVGRAPGLFTWQLAPWGCVGSMGRERPGVGVQRSAGGWPGVSYPNIPNSRN